MCYEYEDIELECRCKARLRVNYVRLAGFNEKEEFNCPGCGQLHSVRAGLPIAKSQIKILSRGIDKNEIDLNPDLILDILSVKGIVNLFHANTVQTSCTFCENGHLLSRDYVESKKLLQTKQYTDELDKKYGIFNDIFMDTIDIHDRAHGRNLYGPILFVFPISILRKQEIHFIRITKQNPSKWNEKDTLSDRYYNSEDEFLKNYKKGDFDSMITFPYVNGKFKLEGNLNHLKVDNPKLIWTNTKKDIHIEAIEKLKAAATAGGLNNKGIGIKIRNCDSSFCRCINQYKLNSKIQEFFR